MKLLIDGPIPIRQIEYTTTYMKRIASTFILISVISLLFSCDTSRQPSANSEEAVSPLPASFDKQGHRGGRGLMPENTIAAMIKAIDLAVTTLEMDAAITADRKVILSHEPYYNSEITTAEDGTVITKANQDSFTIFGMTYEQTLKYDVGLKPYPAFPRQQRVKAIKPLLADVIDSVERYVAINRKTPVSYNIETKSKPSGDNKLHPAPEEYVDLLMAVINQKNIAARTIIQSFDFRTLQVMHKKYPGIRLAALIQNNSSVADNIKEIGFIPDIYSPHFLLVTPQLIEQCHQSKMKVIPWTVNDKAKITALQKMGVDGVISDYPDLF
jgi:glycerophosphoryl diester phosphodiesterase